MNFRINSRLSGVIFDWAQKQERLSAIEKELSREDLWEDAPRAQVLLKEQKEIKAVTERISSLEERLQEGSLYLEMAQEEAEPEALKEAARLLQTLEQELNQLELEAILSGEHDQANALLSINAGAGGTESQDWAEMLLRMYLRWAEDNGYRCEILDQLTGEEAGIKSATISVNGPHAYGYLKGESGVHRLVRISPFDANKRRHTSFASIFVFPQIEEDIEVTIKDEDLRIDTFRSSSAGGQHVNVTDSAVRITHLPTGIVVTCQNERSQHKNKAVAMKVLRSRLYDHYQREQEEKFSKIAPEKKDIAWGSQIRSYVLAPYQMVKDHRTGAETSGVNAVLDGKLEMFIQAFLLSKK